MKKNALIATEDEKEFLGQVIDIFEDFLEGKRGHTEKADTAKTPPMPPVTRFIGQYSYLSNFFPCPVAYGGLTYRCAEAAFQAQKALSQEARETFTEMDAPEAKKAGHCCPLRADWEQVKVHIMEEVVRAKFSQNGSIAEKLAATGNAYLEESNTDRIWGTVNGQGKNLLGRILMKVRSELQEKRLDGQAENEAAIAGTGYDCLAEKLRTMMQEWGVFQKPKNNTRIGFLYRDDSGDMLLNKFVVEGLLSQEEAAEIVRCLGMGRNFLPYKVGLKTSRPSDAMEAEAIGFELARSWLEATDEPPTVKLTAQELLENFRTAKNKWQQE